MKKWKLAEDGVMRLMPRRGRQGSTWFGRVGDVVQQPPVWAGLAAALALTGGRQGRRAALRGSVYYGLAAVVGNLVVKPVVRRSRPPGSGEERIGPVTSSFPSGHAATDLAFTLGAALELPALFVPLSGATLAAHWSLVRSRGHYASDVLAGGTLAVAVALAMWKLWPRRRHGDADGERAGDVGPGI
ncbi:MAG TPA: phosphatase PAP2 family protein [Acidimicrobiales bacterium]|nr:phosphatase PAP2 family protein [Acidimicrobiales bacterium]